ncbi:hypothetical protein N0V93_010337 [Gnomoniopsis smithogilvyi]|uniref:Major facilitator superfamily (MFS) profile domain-containing protein n=1 Tax=Gnomoniopsis smithogilvyi TaxID=1191159 RepID=A0A9W9CSN1_9PEZI|nr:hypothetical protein N0V93_010337 [Gnomoniopsis smithogilvyi]
MIIFQRLTPSLLVISNRNGRRPAYINCFIINLNADIGLALQDNYATLMVLRCLQSFGGSGTTVLGSAIVADVSTRTQRGKNIVYSSMGVTLGPALGSIIGGRLDQFPGWRSIFWFLTIFAAIFFRVVLVAIPETCRAVIVKGGRRHPNALASLKISSRKEAGMILWYRALLYSGYVAVLSTLSTQLKTRYGFAALKITLCYRPLGMGSLTFRWVVGRILDKNFHLQAQLNNLPIIKDPQQDISKVSIETSRLQVIMPIIYSVCLAIIAYSWVMEYETSLAAPLVLLPFVGHLVTGSFSSLNTLVVNINKYTPATAVAANNLFCCPMGPVQSPLRTP